MKNPYEILGVSTDADPDAIRKAYKSLARKFHPDRNKTPAAETRFKEINAAYDIVGDAEKRKHWDEFGEMSTKPGFDANQARAWNRGGGPMPDMGGFGFDFREGADMDDVLGSIFGGGRRSSRGRDQRASLQIEPMMSFIGGETSIQVRRPDGTVDNLQVRIPAGVKDGGTLRLRGQGLPPSGGGPCGDLVITLHISEHPYLRRTDNDLEMDLPITILEALRGASVTVPTPTGEVKITIPAGASAGARLRLRGKGIQRAGQLGDLYLILKPVLPDQRTPEVLAAAEILERAYSSDIRSVFNS